MKKNIFILVILTTSSVMYGQVTSDELVMTLVREYFGSSTDMFVVVDEYLQVKEGKIFYLVRNSIGKANKFSKGIVFTADPNIVPWIIFNNGKIVNTDGTIISDHPSSNGKLFYAFDIIFSYIDGVPPVGSGMHVGYSFDKGRNVPDGFTIEWNDESKRFEEINYLERIYGIPIQPHE